VPVVTTRCTCFSTWVVLDRELWVLVLALVTWLLVLVLVLTVLVVVLVLGLWVLNTSLLETHHFQIVCPQIRVNKISAQISHWIWRHQVIAKLAMYYYCLLTDRLEWRETSHGVGDVTWC